MIHFSSSCKDELDKKNDTCREHQTRDMLEISRLRGLVADLNEQIRELTPKPKRVYKPRKPKVISKAMVPKRRNKSSLLEKLIKGKK